MLLAPHTLQLEKVGKSGKGAGVADLFDASCSSCPWNLKKVTRVLAREEHDEHTLYVRCHGEGG